MSTIIKLICLLCCVFACALPSWAGSTTYYFKVTATAAPTGYGKVYVSENKVDAPADGDWKEESSATGSAKSTGSAASKSFLLYAKPIDGYVFVNWTKGDGTIQGSYQKLSTGVLTSSNKESSNPATFTFTAHFAKAGAVVVKTADEDEALGDASIDKPTNVVGDQVTLTAKANIFAGRFTGWTTPSGLVVKDNPYTFTVTEANKGTYTANFEKIDISTTGIYCYVYNKKTSLSLGLMGISEKTVSSSNRYLTNSIMLLGNSNDLMRSSPAFVLKLTGSPDGSGGLTEARLEAQGMRSNTIAKKTFEFTNQGDHYYIQGSAGSVNGYMVDFSDAVTQEEHFGKTYHPGIYNGANEKDASYHWVISPITENSKDLCFGAKPSAKTVDKNGKYYTTMYTAFPYRCLDGVKAYVVSSVDETSHKVELTEITSGEVPSKTPVILECATTSPTTNRLLPLVTEPAAIEGKNLLKGEIWLKNENETEAEYRTKFDSTTMLVLSNDTLAFRNKNNTDVLAGTGSTGTLTYIANNTCYLQLDDATMSGVTDFSIEKNSSTEAQETTLADLSKKEADGTTLYKLTGEDLQCVTTVADKNYIVVKDGGHSIETTKNSQGYSEYIIASYYNGERNGKLQTDYDQSNWIMVDLSGITGAIAGDYRNHKITSITGTYQVNEPRFKATRIEMGDATAAYKPNHYIATNFMTTYSADGTGNAVADVEGNKFYFMNPKDDEWAVVAWAVWDKAAQAFYVPARDKENNKHGFTGGFNIDLSYNEGNVANTSDLDDKYDKGSNVYTFLALIKKNAANTSADSRRKAVVTPATGAVSSTYTIYPLELDAASVVTVVSDVTASKTVKSVTYYNTLGMAGPEPFGGLNIVVTRYTDGTATTRKVLHR